MMSSPTTQHLVDVLKNEGIEFDGRGFEFDGTRYSVIEVDEGIWHVGAQGMGKAPAMNMSELDILKMVRGEQAPYTFITSGTGFSTKLLVEAEKVGEVTSMFDEANIRYVTMPVFGRPVNNPDYDELDAGAWVLMCDSGSTNPRHHLFSRTVFSSLADALKFYTDRTNRSRRTVAVSMFLAR